MNAELEHQGESTLVAAFGLAALPPEIYQQTVAALQPNATPAQIHAAASAIAEEVSLPVLHGVLGALIYLAQDGGKGSGMPADLVGNERATPALDAAIQPHN